MSKIVHVQTLIMEDDLIRLKEKTKYSTTKDAVAEAIRHYLHCDSM